MKATLETNGDLLTLTCDNGFYIAVPRSNIDTLIDTIKLINVTRIYVDKISPPILFKLRTRLKTKIIISGTQTEKLKEAKEKKQKLESELAIKKEQLESLKREKYYKKIIEDLQGMISDKQILIVPQQVIDTDGIENPLLTALLKLNKMQQDFDRECKSIGNTLTKLLSQNDTKEND